MIYYLFLTNLSDFNEKLSPSQRHRGSGSIGKLIDVAYSFNDRNIRRSQISLTRAKISSCASHRGEISFSSAAVLSADKLTRVYAGASTRPPREGAPVGALISLSSLKIIFSRVLEINENDIFPFCF